jgi:response regulator of citrate/malate metabolism
MNKNIKVLIVDDKKHLVELMRKIFSEYNGIEVIGIATNTNDERAKIETLKPDVVITDSLKNAEYTGLDLIEEYSKKDKKLYFYIISSDANEIDKEEFKKYPQIIGSMRKPFIDYDKVVNDILNINQ